VHQGLFTVREAEVDCRAPAAGTVLSSIAGDGSKAPTTNGVWQARTRSRLDLGGMSRYGSGYAFSLQITSVGQVKAIT
jgi:hypothetical protein